MRRPVLAFLACVPLLAAACSPVVNQRGYLPDPDKVASVQIGVDDKQSVEARLGTPSSVGTFQSDVCYYISSKEEQEAFYWPETTERNVLAISFDASGKVAAVDHYDLNNGKEIALTDRETPTRGREMSILQQLFSNISHGYGSGGDSASSGGSTPSGGQ